MTTTVPSHHEAPPSLGLSTAPATSREYHTGSWRTRRPVYVELSPPCSLACPAHEDVRGWLAHVQVSGQVPDAVHQAWLRLVEANPFPATMGRICYHPCQGSCNRGTLDEEVGINAVERYVGDKAIEQGWRLPAPGAATGHRVVVVGAGPGGLSAAYHLRRVGHAVTVREASEEPGGMMRYGIPAYRLPRQILDAEIRRILEMGVTLECGVHAADLHELEEEFDAVVLATGADVSHAIHLPARDGAKVFTAVDLLRSTSEGAPPLLGRRVAVYGAGNTAMDVARTARRLGASDTVVISIGSRAQMSAYPAELADAVAEGVHARWLSAIDAVGPEGLTVERMRLDVEGAPVGTGELTTLKADDVVLAVGQDIDRTLIDAEPEITVTDGVVAVDAAMMTGRAGVFAAGDVAPGQRTATFAIGQGAAAARSVTTYLAKLPQPPAVPEREATYDRLTTWYYADAPEQVRGELAAARRVKDFSEVTRPLAPEQAVFEARRCMSCGSCFECDNCYGMCPDDAIIKLGPGEKYRIDYDYCKGCGICAQECPCGAIDMVPEER